MAQTKPIYGYWNFRAGFRGQVGRYLLAYAGVDFEDKRYEIGNKNNEWSANDK